MDEELRQAILDCLPIEGDYAAGWGYIDIHREGIDALVDSLMTLIQERIAGKEGKPMSEPIQWSALTPEERDALVHSKVLVLPLNVPCTDGQIDEHMGIYWRCTCGWISDFQVGEDTSTAHSKPIPHYTTSMDAACTIPTQPQFFGANTEIVCVPQAYWGGMGDTPAEAVCIAFLKACDVEFEDE